MHDTASIVSQNSINKEHGTEAEQDTEQTCLTVGRHRTVPRQFSVGGGFIRPLPCQFRVIREANNL